MNYEEMTPEQKKIYRESNPPADEVYEEVFLQKSHWWPTKSYVNKHVDNSSTRQVYLVL